MKEPVVHCIIVASLLKQVCALAGCHFFFTGSPSPKCVCCFMLIVVIVTNLVHLGRTIGIAAFPPAAGTLSVLVSVM